MISVFDPKEIVQPSSIAIVVLVDWCDPAFWELHWHNKGRRFDPRTGWAT